MKRPAVLPRYGVFDRACSQALSEIVDLVSAICEVPLADISFHENAGSFAYLDLEKSAEAGDSSPSDFAGLQGEVEGDLVIAFDVSDDPRFIGHSLTKHFPLIRFYAGAAIKVECGLIVGTLYICDYQPRVLTAAQTTALTVLADQIASQLELCRLSEAYALAERRQRAIAQCAQDLAIITTDLDDVVIDWSEGAERILGWSASEMLGRRAAVVFTPENRPVGGEESEGRQARGHGWAPVECWRQRKDGSLLWSSEDTSPLNDAYGAHIGYIKVLRDRTERHLAGGALDDAEVALRCAEEAGGVGVFHIGLDGIVHATPHFCRIFGVQSFGPAPARLFEDLILDEDQHLISDVQLRVMGEAPMDVEYRIRRADTGEVRWISRKGEIQRDEWGKPIRFSGVARDITEEREGRESLARSEERYRALFNAIDDGFSIIEFIDGPHGPLSDYRYIEANPACERHTGIANIVGSTIRGLVDDTHANEWLGLFGEVLRTGQPLRVERYFETAGRHIEVSATRVEPASRRQVSVLYRDVEERRRSEEALRESEALARENIGRVQMALSAGAIIGTWHWDLVNDQFNLDDAFIDAFGLDPTVDRDGDSIAHFMTAIHPEDRAEFATSVADIIERGGTYSQQFRVMRAEGEYRWIEANGRVDIGEDGVARDFPGVLLDIEKQRTVTAERDRATAALRALNDNLEQRIAERTKELMQAEEHLRQAQKMEAVGQLTGGIAHDFNNMLTGVIGSLDLIERYLTSGRMERVHKYIDAATVSAQRAAALTARLLAFGRRQSLDLVATNVNDLVLGMEELLICTLGEQVKIETRLAEGLWMATSDTSQLENALLNLCINARDAMIGGGKLRIETANAVLDDHYVSVHTDVMAGEYVVLSVSDTGMGMTASTIDKVFEPFFTTKPIGQGTGLGLSMIYGFARQAGGHVRVSSKLGLGTIVRLYMPRRHCRPEDGKNAEALIPAEVPLGAGETVMVVEDDASVRLIVLDVLNELGYEAIEAADASGAIPLLNSDRNIDLLISDVGLPGMNGRQLAEVARAARPDLRVLFITGYAENAAVRGGFLDSGMEMLTKPFAVDELATKVREMLAVR